MVDVSAVALSGLFANQKRISVAANNIANANTEDFQAQEVIQSSNAGGGVNTRVAVRNPATITVPNNEGGTSELPNVSLEQELIEADVASYNAQANLKVLQAQDKLDKYLLDIQA
jgi:flagellar hook protein FlgE